MLREEEAMEFIEQVVLRGLHVLAGSFWVGAAIVMAGFLAPSARKAGKPGAAFMRVLNGWARLPVVTNIAAILTLITGVWLLWQVSGGLEPAWFGTSYGITLTAGMLSALVAYLISVLVQRPAMQRMARAQAGDTPPDAAAQAALAGAQARLTWGGRAGAVLLAVSTVCMAIARYV